MCADTHTHTHGVIETLARPLLLRFGFSKSSSGATNQPSNQPTNLFNN